MSVCRGYTKIKQVSCDADSDIEDGSTLNAVAFSQPLKGFLPPEHMFSDSSIIGEAPCSEIDVSIWMVTLECSGESWMKGAGG